MINTKVCMLLYCNDCHFKTSFLPSSYRGKDLRENYCRNPRGEEGGPWCFTTSPETRHEVCNIPLCSQGKPAWLTGKVAFSLLTERTASLPIVSVTLGHGLWRKTRWFLSNNNSRSEKSSYYRKRSCYVPVLWKTWTSFQAQQLFFRSRRRWNNEALLIAQMWPFIHLSGP